MRLISVVTLSSLSFCALFAMSAPADYVDGLKRYLNNQTFKVNGKFYMYDFEHDGTINRNDWLYIDTSSGKVFRLMGRTPSSQDPFGWLPITSIPRDLDVTNPTGYFVFIDYPKDREMFGTNAFSWVFVTQGLTFKLMGATPDHNFDYLDENGDGKADPLSGVHYNFQGLDILFMYDGVLSTPSQALQQPTQPQKCEEEESFTYEDTGFYLKTNSWYKGNIAYNCKKDAKYRWELVGKESITISQIIKKIKGTIDLDGKKIEGVETFNYQEGTIHHQGTYEGQSYDCYDYYIPQLPITISKYEHEKLEKVMEWYGEGPCDPSFIRTTCPDWYHGSLEDCSLEGEATYNDRIDQEIKKATHVKAEEDTKWDVTDSDGILHQVYRYQYYQIDR